MSVDDLSAPLGFAPAKKRRLVIPISPAHGLVALLGLFTVVFALWVLLAHDPYGGEPVAVATIELRTEPAGATKPANGQKPAGAAQATSPDAAAMPPATAPAAAAQAPASAAPAGSKTVTIIDGMSGKRQDILVPDTRGEKASPGIDQRYLEVTRHGPIPKIGPNGARPVELYAQAVKAPAGKIDGPRIAIVVRGLGISAAVTSDAFAKLPAPVTFSFAPYATDLDRIAARARGEGHETLLQVPMEPFDYPDNDPGPQTLLTSLSAEQNMDRLHWLMSRFQGYVGIANAMGARFTASEQAITPVMRETSKRGLMFFDDGSSPRSLAAQLAGANNLPYAKADVALDSVPTPVEIDRALNRLEMMARERGAAVGVASALPASIDRIAQWAKSAAARGLVLVPISAIALKAKSSS